MSELMTRSGDQRLTLRFANGARVYLYHLANGGRVATYQKADGSTRRAGTARISGVVDATGGARILAVGSGSGHAYRWRERPGRIRLHESAVGRSLNDSPLVRARMRRP